MRITFIIYVLKQLFNRTNSSFFFIVYYYSWFIELKLNPYKLFLFLRLSIHQVLFLEFYCDWSKIYYKFFVQSFFCWFLNVVYHMYCIIVHWFWNLFSGVIENCQWALSKLDTWICLPQIFVEGCGKGDGFCDCTCFRQYIYWLQGSSSISSSLQWWS